jgi:hypothetical protein
MGNYASWKGRCTCACKDKEQGHDEIVTDAKPIAKPDVVEAFLEVPTATPI